MQKYCFLRKYANKFALFIYFYYFCTRLSNVISVTMRVIRHTFNLLIGALIALLMPGCKAHKTVTEDSPKPQLEEVDTIDRPIMVKYGVPPALRQQRLNDASSTPQ